MADIPTANISVLKRINLGNRVLVVASVKSDATGVSYDASVVGLSRIDACWCQSVDDTAIPSVNISDYSGTSITFLVSTSGKYYLHFLIGY
jgi:hypothetical protein